MDISNRSFASLMLNLEACERKLDSVLRKNSYGHLNKAGVSPDFRKNSDVYKWNFHYEINISWTFQIDPSLLWCLILRLVKGNLILLGGNFSMGIWTRQGVSPDFPQNSDFFKRNFHYETNISCTFQIDPSLLWCSILRLVKGNLILFWGKLARNI